MSDVTAPMAGKVIDVKVNVGDTVNEDDDLIILEAMKMEIPIVAPCSGTVKKINVKEKDEVKPGSALMEIG